MLEMFEGRKVLIVGLGRTGFALINFFNLLKCEIKVTDIKPIFDLNKVIKRLKKIVPQPQMTLGEHRNEDFLEADIIVYSSSVDPKLAGLELARKNGKEVHSEFGFAYKYCKKPIIAVLGNYGRTTVSHMIGYTLKMDGKKVFVGGTSEEPFINFLMLPEKDFIDYVVLEVSPEQLQTTPEFHPLMAIYPNLEERKFDPTRFRTIGEYIETCLSPIKNMNAEDYLVVNFDRLAGNSFLRNSGVQTYWYSRRSFVVMGVIAEIQGTHFHDKRIHSNIHFHSEFKVNQMRVIGLENRENLLAVVTTCKALKVSEKAIQQCIVSFPGIPNRLDFVVEKNGVLFYNDSKSETMEDFRKTLEALKAPAIVIAGGKETEQEFEPYSAIVKEKVRILVLVGESKEGMNRHLGDFSQTYLVGSFDESVLLAYQKSRTDDIIILCPGNSSTDIFRDYEEKGSYYKKLIYQL